MKWIGTILVIMIIPLALIGLAAYMMSIHQKGSGWVIAAVVVICCSIDIRFRDQNDNDETDK